MKEFRFWAIRRSGHHAVLNWIAENLKGRVFFKNNISNRGKDFHNLRKCSVQFSEIPDFYLYNIEERFIDEMLLEMKKYKKMYKYMRSPITDVIVMRDPFNLFASRIQASKSKPSIVKEFGSLTTKSMLLYRHYAREFLRETKILSAPICINFNSWFSSETYRRELANIFGFAYSDAGLQTVGFPQAGLKTPGISSFDNLSFDGKARSMKILERWKHIDKKMWRKLTNDKELIELSGRIFDLSSFKK